MKKIACGAIGAVALTLLAGCASYDGYGYSGGSYYGNAYYEPDYYSGPYYGGTYIPYGGTGGRCHRGRRLGYGYEDVDVTLSQRILALGGLTLAQVDNDPGIQAE